MGETPIPHSILPHLLHIDPIGALHVSFSGFDATWRVTTTSMKSGE
jgi:hypothetical protein